MTDTSRIAVVLFNLGGPDSISAIQPFLFNLFNDPAIIKLPGPVRYLVAWILSSRRAKTAVAIYDHLGGRSPLLDNTLEQAQALQQALTTTHNLRTFVTMRYWHPRADDVVRAIADFDPDRIVLLPLYPQWSTTTTASSFTDWRRACRRYGLDKPTQSICCYPVEPGFIGAIATLVREQWQDAVRWGRPRVLFSAHGLPKRVVDGGDPYQWQCEQTASAVVSALQLPEIDWVNCYQSRVGPLEWIGPATDAEIIRAGREKRPVIVVPIAFVSEHSETLVELDIEYQELAAKCGVPRYLRVSTVGVNALFIGGLASLVRATLTRSALSPSASHGRTCPTVIGGCSYRTGQNSGVA